MGLPSEVRLKKKRDFDFIFKKGKSFSTPILRLSYLKNNLGQSHFAVVVSTKISKKATQRNKIKRRLYSLIRTNLNQIKSGYNLIFIVKPEILKKKFSDLEKFFLKTLDKLGLLKKNG